MHSLQGDVAYFPVLFQIQKRCPEQHGWVELGVVGKKAFAFWANAGFGFQWVNASLDLTQKVQFSPFAFAGPII